MAVVDDDAQVVGAMWLLLMLILVFLVLLVFASARPNGALVGRLGEHKRH